MDAPPRLVVGLGNELVANRIFSNAILKRQKWAVCQKDRAMEKFLKKH